MMNNKLGPRQPVRQIWASLIPAALVLICSLQASMAERVRDLISRDVVTFIFQEKGTNTTAIGTGFFVGVPVKTTPINHVLFLVTAKHVLFDEKEKLLPEIILRMDRPQELGGFFNLSVFFEGPYASKVFTHPDESVDIAVVPLLFDTKTARLSAIPANLIVARESFKQLSIQEGDEMFFLGLFTPFYGSKHNLPIYRFGRLSMLSEEKIPFGKNLKQDLLLMETAVFGGNSGSPCFFHFDEKRNPNDTKFLIAGVVKGYFRDWSEVQVVETKSTPISSDNTGISAVIPGYYIADILQGAEITKLVADMEKAFIPVGSTNPPQANPPK